MNTLTNFKQRVRAAYKGRPRQNRQIKRRGLRNDVEDALHANELSTASIASTVTSSSMNNHLYERQSTSQVHEVAEIKTKSCHGRHDDNGGILESPACLEPTIEADIQCEQVPESPVMEEWDESAEHADLLQEDETMQDEQALRDGAYVMSNGEEPDDYTYGPARMVVASDGVKNCAAILLTLELSGKIQKSLRAQRNFDKAKRVAYRQIEVALNFEGTLMSEIANHESRLARFEGTDLESAEAEKLNAELEALQEMLRHSSTNRDCIKSSLSSRGNTLREIQAQTNAVLEETFIAARLLEPAEDRPDTPIEELDLQEEYQEFCVADGMNSDVSLAPLDTNNDHLMVMPQALTAEQEHELKLKQDVWARYEDLRNAQTAFDHRVSDRARAWQANLEAIANGEEDVYPTQEEFDLAWLKSEQDLTRRLIEAEVDFSTTKAAAVDAGIDPPIDDQASGFVNDVTDGYRMSMELDLIASVPSPKVKNWLSGVPELASPSFNHRVEEGDEWEAEDVGISDSVSVVAEGSERRRIDKWREVCGL